MNKADFPDSYLYQTPSEIINAVQNGQLSQTMFSMGCFWGPDANFGSLSGVVQTRVGYAGAVTSNPTYRDVKGHAETVRIFYNKNQVSYKDLIGNFESWKFTGKREGQYRPAFYIFDNEQKLIIEELTQEIGIENMPSIFYANQMESYFWAAEDYHQKYKLRKNKRFAALAEQEFGIDWDQHLFFTKLNGDGKKGYSVSSWLDKLSGELQTAYRLG